MRRLICVSLLACSAPAAAQTVYLSCSTTETPTVTWSQLYISHPYPTDQVKFAVDILRAGGRFIAPDNESTVVVDYGRKVVSLSDNEAVPLEVSPTALAFTLSDGMATTLVKIDRVSGRMTYTSYYSDIFLKNWTKEFGGKFSPALSWEMLCEPVDRQF